MDRLVQQAVLGQLRHSRIASLSFAILFDSAGFRLASSGTAGAQLRPQRESLVFYQDSFDLFSINQTHNDHINALQP